MKNKNNYYHSYQRLLNFPLSVKGFSSEKEELILKYAPLIKQVVERLAIRLPAHINKEDLFSAGLIGLLDALTKFNPEKKVKFETYAEIRIKGAILDELRSLDWFSRSARQKANHLEKVLHILGMRKGGDLEDEEIAQEMGLSLREYYDLLNEIRAVNLLDIESLEEKFLPNGEKNLFNLITGEMENHPLHEITWQELKKDLAKAIEELTEKEKVVLNLYYYEELTLKEIGDVLGYTESRICQIHAKAILKLRAKLREYLGKEEASLSS